MAKKRTVAKKTAKKKPSRTISFDYIKSNSYRVVYVDGVFGGMTPRGGNIHMATWNQRSPHPDQVTHEVLSNGIVGPEVGRKIGPNVVRELEVGLVFDKHIAQAMIGWLQTQIKQIEETEAAAAEAKK